MTAITGNMETASILRLILYMGGSQHVAHQPMLHGIFARILHAISGLLLLGAAILGAPSNQKSLQPSNLLHICLSQ